MRSPGAADAFDNIWLYFDPFQPAMRLTANTAAAGDLERRLDAVLIRVARNAVQALRRPELATLVVGSPADMAFLTTEAGSLPYTDARQEMVYRAARLTCEATISRGRVIFDRPSHVG